MKKKIKVISYRTEKEIRSKATYNSKELFTLKCKTCGSEEVELRFFPELYPSCGCSESYDYFYCCENCGAVAIAE